MTPLALTVLTALATDALITGALAALLWHAVGREQQEQERNR